MTQQQLLDEVIISIVTPHNERKLRIAVRFYEPELPLRNGGLHGITTYELQIYVDRDFRWQQ